MTRRDWWLGVVAVVIAIVLHAALPRYEWRHLNGFNFARVDRWTGTVTIGGPRGDHGQWMAFEPRPAPSPPLGIVSYTPSTPDDDKTLDALAAQYGGKRVDAPRPSNTSAPPPSR